MSVLHSDDLDDAGARPVTFQLPADVHAGTVALVGDFNDWQTDQHLLHHQDDGSWQLVVRLPPGRYRFRYLIDGARWENDWYADEYAANEFGGDDSVVVVAPGPVDADARDGNVVAEIADYFVDDPRAPQATDVPADLPPPPNA